MKYVVSVSGGAGSTIAAHRTVEKYGLDSTVLVFADTKSESPDLYRMLDHMDKMLKQVVRISDGRDIWDIFNDEGIIRTPTGACKASIELKKKPLDSWISARYKPGEAVMVTGLGYDETERQERFDRVRAPYQTWHPLNDPPILSHCQLLVELTRLGYPKQELYEAQYPHNNCGGACVLAGLAQWKALREEYPDRFAYAMRREKEFNNRYRDGKEPYTVLRDQSAQARVVESEGSCDLFGNRQVVEFQRTVRSITLEEFAKRLDTNSIDVTRDFRSGCGCMTLSLDFDQT